MILGSSLARQQQRSSKEIPQEQVDPLPHRLPEEPYAEDSLARARCDKTRRTKRGRRTPSNRNRAGRRHSPKQNIEIKRKENYSMKRKSKLMLGISAMVLAAGTVGATGTFAWFQATAASVTVNNNTSATIATAEASVGGKIIKCTLTYDQTNLMPTDTSGNAKVWNANNELVDASYGAKYATVTMDIEGVDGQDYSQLGASYYYISVSTSQTKARLNHALVSSTYVGEHEAQVVKFQFSNAASLTKRTATFYLAITPVYTATSGSYSAGSVDSDAISVANDSWTFTAAATGTQTVTAS